MHSIPNRTKVDDQLLVYLYREVLFPWETQFQHQKFLLPKKQEGFNSFCSENNIIVESPTSSIKLEEAHGTFSSESKKLNGLFRITAFTRRSGEDREAFTVPKLLLYHLRNSVAHASFGKKRMRGNDQLYFEGWYRNKLKIQAQIRESLFPEFVKAVVSTRVD